MKPILPIKRDKQAARRYYDRLSAIYDWLTQSETGFIERGLALLDPKPGETLLEIGVGTGKAIAQLTGQERQIFGLDLSWKMLRQTQKKPSQGVVELIQGDGCRLPLRAKKFDAVYCAFTLELFSLEDIKTVLNEMQRVLKPDGRLGIVSMAPEPRTPILWLYEFAHRLFPTAVDCRPIPLGMLLEKNGFAVQKAHTAINWGLPIQTAIARPIRNHHPSSEND